MAERLAYLEAVVGADITSFRRSMGEARDNLGLFERQLQSLSRLGQNMTYAITAPVLAAGTAFVSAAADFDAVARNTASISAEFAASFEVMSSRVLELGSNIRAGPTEAMNAFYEIVSAGITDPEDAFLRLNDAILLSEAGLTDLSDTTRALNASLMAYGASASEATHYSDVWSQTVALGVGRLQEFQSGLTNAIPAAAALGVSFEELGAGAAFMTQAGYTASKAGTQLTMALSQMLVPGEALNALYGELGVSGGQQLVEQFGGLEGALYAIGEAAEWNEETLARAFGSREARRMILTFSQNADAFSEFMEQFNSTLDGATIRQREQQMQSFTYQLDMMKASFQGLSITLGQAIIPKITPFINGLTTMFERIRRTNPEIIDFAINWAMVAAAIGPALMVITHLFNPLMVLAALFVGLGTAVHENLFGITDAIKDFVSPIIGPLRDVGKGITDFITLFQNAASNIGSENFEGFTLFDAFMVAVRVRGPAIIQGIKDVFEGIKIAIWEALPALDEVGGNILNTIAGWFSPTGGSGDTPIYRAIKELFSGDIAGAIDELIPGLGTNIDSGLGNLFQGMWDRIPQIRSGVSSLLKNVGDWLVADGIPTLARSFGYLLGRVGTIVGQGMGDIWSSLFSPDDGGATGAGTAASGAVDTVVTPFLQGVQDAFAEGDITNPIDGFFTMLAGALTVGAGISLFGSLLMGKGFAGALWGSVHLVLTAGSVLAKFGLLIARAFATTMVTGMLATPVIGSITSAVMGLFTTGTAAATTSVSGGALAGPLAGLAKAVGGAMATALSVAAGVGLGGVALAMLAEAFDGADADPVTDSIVAFLDRATGNAVSRWRESSAEWGEKAGNDIAHGLNNMFDFAFTTDEERAEQLAETQINTILTNIGHTVDNALSSATYDNLIADGTLSIPVGKKIELTLGEGQEAAARTAWEELLTQIRDPFMTEEDHAAISFDAVFDVQLGTENVNVGTVLGEVLTTDWAAINADISSNLNSTLVDAITTGSQAAIVPASGSMYAAFNEMVTVFTGGMSGEAKNAIVDASNDLFSSAFGEGSPAANSLTTFAALGVTAVDTLIQQFNRLGLELPTSLQNVITNVTPVADRLKTIFGGILSSVQNVTGLNTGSLMNTLGGLVNAIGGVTGESSTTGQGAIGSPGKAIGGSLFANSPVLVGEHGPEIFNPSGSGSINPFHQLRADAKRSGSSGTSSVQNNINVYGVQDVDALLRELKRRGIVLERN